MQITRKDVANARLGYWLLMISPAFIFTCPLMAIVAVLFVLVQAFAKRSFVAAHARQGLTLTGLGVIALILVFAFDNFQNIYVYLFLAGIWILANSAGLAQAGSGNSWIGLIRAEIVPDGPVILPSAPLPAKPATEKGKSVEHYLHLFRSGSPAERVEAILMLNQLGEVEIF